MHRVLITGAAGDIGGRLRRSLAGAYPVLRLSDIAPLGEAGWATRHRAWRWSVPATSRC